MTPVVRKMNLSDLELALEWAQAEGWGPGKGDVAAFFAADPDGFWALELDGEMVASLSAVGSRVASISWASTSCGQIIGRPA